MRKMFVGKRFVEKATQLIPPVSVLPTHNEQIFIDSAGKVRQYVSIVLFVSEGRLLVIPFRRVDTKHVVPPVWFYEVVSANPLAFVMPLQASHVRLGIFSQRQDKFTVWKALVQLLVD